MQVSKPAWWQLYATLPLMVALLVAEEKWPLPGLSNEVATMAIVLLSFGAMFVWVNINGPRLERYYWERDGAGGNHHLVVYQLDPDPANENASELSLDSLRVDCVECPKRTGASRARKRKLGPKHSAQGISES